MFRALHTKRGFTLVELLVVIAIIGILSSFVILGLGRMRGKGEVADVTNTLRQMETLMTDYYTEHGTFPPALGMLSKEAFNLTDTQKQALSRSNPGDADMFVTKHYMAELGLWGKLDYYDRFGRETTDTDDDGKMGILEYMPNTSNGIDSSPADYDFNNPPAPRLEQRTFIYAPVNLRQFRQFKKYWDDGARNMGTPGEDPSAYYGYPDFWDTGDSDFPQLRFPPAQYDAYVLISAGLLSNTQGMVYSIGSGLDDRIPPASAGGPDEVYYAHICALATYYMATRDLKGGPDGTPDGIADFDYFERQSNGQGQIPYPYDGYNINGVAPRVDWGGRTYGKRGLGIDGPIYRVME